MPSRPLDRPIRYESDEGKDDQTFPGTSDPKAQKSPLVELTAVDTHALYNAGEIPGIAATGLYPNGIGDPARIAILTEVNEQLRGVQAALPQDLRLLIASGFLSPNNQLTRYQIRASILHAGRKLDPWEEIQASEVADSAGSVAHVQECDALDQMTTQYMDDSNLMALLRERSGQDDVETFVYQLIQARANRGVVSLPLLVSSAVSVHNRGASVNAFLTRDGEVLNTGIGLDTPDPKVQAVDYFEKAIAADYERAIKANPEIGRFLEEMGVTEINEDVIEDIRRNRRVLWNAMLAMGFQFYRGENGHFTGKRRAPYNSADELYPQAQAMGYRVTL